VADAIGRLVEIERLDAGDLTHVDGNGKPSGAVVSAYGRTKAREQRNRLFPAHSLDCFQDKGHQKVQAATINPDLTTLSTFQPPGCVLKGSDKRLALITCRAKQTEVGFARISGRQIFKHRSCLDHSIDLVKFEVARMFLDQGIKVKSNKG
jgi:hypothetical protein